MAHAPGLHPCAAKAMLRYEAEDPGAGIAETMLDTDCLHNDLDIEVYFDTQSLSGSNTMTLRSLVDGLGEFTFMLQANFAISSVVIDGTTIPGTDVASIGTYGRRVTLPRAYAQGEQFTVRVNYSGPVQESTTRFLTYSGLPYVGTLSEPWYAGTWWPCKDSDWSTWGDNSDKATLDIAITAPETMVSVSNGVLQGVDLLSGNRKRYRWHTDYPMATYLVCFASHPFLRHELPYEHGNGTMPFEMYFSPADDTEANRAICAKSLDMIRAFRPLFGEYPFVEEKYGVYDLPFAAMEHQTISGFPAGRADFLTAHELAHQWWGDDVTCRTWHDAWLNEGAATYGEALWEERKPGSSGGPAYRAYMLGMASLAHGPWPVYANDMNHFWDVGMIYYKGAWVFHMLRGVVGDDVFARILSAYRSEYSGKAATTQDFIAVCSGVVGADMQYFFDQWVYGIGEPWYSCGWRTVSINGQNYLRLSVAQVQHPSYGANGVFKMPIDIRVDRAGGSTSYRIFNDARTEHFVIPITYPATGIAVDEFAWILSTPGGTNSYVNGPAKIVQAVPAPGAAVDGPAPSSMTVTFSENVTAQAAHFGVAGPSGPVAFAFSYSPGNFTATLDTGTLAPGEYTVTVSEQVRTTAASILLDGEIADVPAPLPSGEGLPGGNAVYTFTVERCRADFNADGQADFFDYLDFAMAFDADDAAADFNGDAQIDFFDYLDFVQAFDAGCD